MAKRPSYTEYQADVLSSLGYRDAFDRAKSIYNFNMRAALQGASQGQSFLTVADRLKALPNEYSYGPNLLYSPPHALNELTLQQKPFESVLDKVYRKNVLFNKYYPDLPDDAVTNPVDMYTKIDDLLRSRVICKYMDGPRYCIDALHSICETHGIDSYYRELSTDAGYYAWHYYFKVPVEVSISNDVRTLYMTIELQFTTQLAEVITSLTHGLYKQRREGVAPEKDWKWDPNSLRFRSSYIGHGLHLLEGIIQSFRDEVLASRDPESDESESGDLEGLEAETDRREDK